MTRGVVRALRVVAVMSGVVAAGMLVGWMLFEVAVWAVYAVR